MPCLLNELCASESLDSELLDDESRSPSSSPKIAWFMPLSFGKRDVPLGGVALLTGV
jgi:hypothetical protein